MSKGYVYVLSNPSMPGLVKIGKTTRPVGMRAAELWQTGVPTPFDVVHQVYSPECGVLERTMHKAFEESRVSPGREFFTVDGSIVAAKLTEEHRLQVEEFVDEYLPEHALVWEDFLVDPSDLYALAKALSVTPQDVVSALHFIEPDEMRPALARWFERVRK